MRTIAAARSKDILRHCWLHDVRDMLVPYSVSLEWQRSLLLERLKILREIRARNATVCTSTMNLPQLSGIQSDAIIALEHPSVYTLGRRCGHDHLKFNPEEPRCPHEVHQVERGGNVTWHGPGQLVVYPILDLRHHKMDLGWYQRSLEEVVIRVLADHGIKGTRDKTATGVWVDGAKIAAIGVGVSRWITLHGFSLNICPSMDGFSRIIPCGIPGIYLDILGCSGSNSTFNILSPKAKSTVISANDRPAVHSLRTLKNLDVEKWISLCPKPRFLLPRQTSCIFERLEAPRYSSCCPRTSGCMHADCVV